MVNTARGNAPGAWVCEPVHQGHEQFAALGIHDQSVFPSALVRLLLLETGMRHIDDQEWIDFVRGLTEPARSIELEAHLAEGCSSCQTAVSWWRGLVDLAGRARQPVPEDAVENVKAAFSLTKAYYAPPNTIQFATLVSDSFRTPSLQGARSTRLGQRHCVYESDGFTVEFHLGAGRENDSAFLIGHIDDPLKRNQALDGSRVKLVQGTSVIGDSIVNSFGEFTMEMMLPQSQWILIEIPEQAPIAIPIPNLISLTAGGGQRFERPLGR